MSALAGVSRQTDGPLARIESISGQNVFACYQCGHCTSDCPFSLSPSLVMRFMQLGQLEHARILTTTWECASCYACETGCPKGLSPVKVIKALQSLNGGRPLTTLYQPAPDHPRFASVRSAGLHGLGTAAAVYGVDAFHEGAVHRGDARGVRAGERARPLK
jgi:Fe-S oxidoreductase